MTEKTKCNVLARMTLMQAKLRMVGTPQALKAVEIFAAILRGEMGHMAIGNHW